jgi:hypothetical protein
MAGGPAPTPPPAGKSSWMGSYPTLDRQELAAEALELDPDDLTHGHAVAHLAADHPQVRLARRQPRPRPRPRPP